MKAASREAQSHVTGKLEELIRNADNSVAVAAQIGTELFLTVDQLDTERALRIAVADTSVRRRVIFPRVEPSMTSSPTRTTIPPRRLGSTSEWMAISRP